MPRGGELALAYAGLVLLVAVVLSILPEDVHQRAVLSASTNIDNLRHDPAAVLLLSAFVVRSLGEVLLLLPLVVVMTVCSRRIGRASTVVAALFGHVGATLVVATFLAAGVRQGAVPRSVTTAPDVGVSYALAGMAGLLAACLPRRWRWAYVVGGLVALGVLLRVDPDFTNVGHLLAFTTGLGLAVVSLQSRPRTPPTVIMGFRPPRSPHRRRRRSTSAVTTHQERRVLRYGDDPQQEVEVWSPDGRARGTAVLVHGGYWRTPWAADLMHPLVPAFLARGWRVAVPEYRRIGSGGGWPATSDDVGASLTVALDARAEDDDGPVVLVGHSAGGHLALLHSGVADAVVALAPVTDLVRGYAEGIGRGAVAELMDVSPGAAPEAYRAASPRQRPWPAHPVLVVHGTDDDRVPVEHSRDWAAAARAGGAPVELVEPASLDHMALIDPSAPHWPGVHAWLDTTLSP